MRPKVSTLPFGSRCAWIATCGQVNGDAQLPTLNSSAAVAKETTTVWVWFMGTTQVPAAVPTPVPLTSQPAPDHAFTKLPAEAEALSVTDAADGNEASQPEPAVPPLIGQVMPTGFEATLPLPLAPPCTVSAKLLGGDENAAVTARSELIVT